MRYEASTRHSMGHLRLEVGVDNNQQNPSLVVRMYTDGFSGPEFDLPIAEFRATELSTLIENLTIALQCLESRQASLDKRDMQRKEQ